MNTAPKAPAANELMMPEYIAEMATTSAKIRALTAEGWSRSQIARGLGIRYQHVRTVQLIPLSSQSRHSQA